MKSPQKESFNFEIITSFFGLEGIPPSTYISAKCNSNSFHLTNGSSELEKLRHTELVGQSFIPFYRPVLSCALLSVFSRLKCYFSVTQSPKCTPLKRITNQSSHVYTVVKSLYIHLHWSPLATSTWVLVSYLD